jgi:hypothetical protein
MFIAVGYTAAAAVDERFHPGALILVIIVVGEGFAVAVWRRTRRRMIRRSPPHMATPNQED